MEEEKKSRKGIGGQPAKTIDWELLDELVAAGCTGAQVAGVFKMHPDVFYQKFKKLKGIRFGEYAPAIELSGQAKILLRQYQRALGTVSGGSDYMLGLLGKVRLKQDIYGKDSKDMPAAMKADFERYSKSVVTTVTKTEQTIEPAVDRDMLDDDV